MSDILGMSDEDFLKQPMPSGIEEQSSPAAGDAGAVAEASVVPETTASTEVEAATTTPVEGGTPAGTPTEATTEGGDQGVSGSTGSAAASPAATTDPTPGATQPGTVAGTKEGEQPGPKAGAEGQQPGTSPDYEGFYKQIMTPFKANGRNIELRTPEEAIQLMQMGANYTKKMQELVPHRKVLTMLQNNGLLDEGKLSFLIDVEKKNPEAIKKLVKDAGLDPMEIDTSVEPAYRDEGNHRVSDEEVVFHSTLDDMKSTQAGMETLKVINGDWDQASKEVLWKTPEVMTIIHEQRESGVYARIAAEVARQQTLGAIPASTPFLQAYKAVGDQMVAARAFTDLDTKPAPAAPVVVATRVEAPKAPVTNGDRAAAASTTRTTPATAKPFVNPLAMSDDDFMAQFKGRL